MLRIVHVLQWLEVGGAELVALELAAAQRLRGNEVVLLVLRGEQGPLMARVAGTGLDLRLVGGRTHGRDLGLYPRISRLLSEIQPDVVHTHDPASLFYGAPVARLHGAVVVHTKHGSDIDGRRRQLFARLAAELAHQVIAVSEDVAQIARRTREVPARKLQVIENGVDTERFSPNAVIERRRVARERFGLPSQAVVIGCIARVEPVKRHALLLEAVLPTLGEERWLLIVGDGSQREAIAAQVAKHALGRFVRLPGMVDDPLEALAALDAFVLASSHEGLPLALLEALAVGLPVIASSVGGIPKVIEHGVSGWLVHAGDPGDPNVLRAAINEVLVDPQRCSTLRSEARRRVVESYSLERVCGAYLSLYHRFSSQ